MGLDPYLPVWYFRAAADRECRYEYALRFSEFDSILAPWHLLRYASPANPESRNQYVCALFDLVLSDQALAQVGLIPQPSLSAADARARQQSPLAAEPLPPSSFVVHLYSPKLDIVVSEEKKSKLFGTVYHFSFPQTNFLRPTESALDQNLQEGNHDNPLTIKLQFMWKRDGGDLVCQYTGKSTETSKKRGGREPNPVVAKLGNGLRELVIIDGSLARTGIEDFVGLRFVFLLSALTIRDVYWKRRLDPFNQLDPAIHADKRKSSGGFLGRRKSVPNLMTNTPAPISVPAVVANPPQQHATIPVPPTHSRPNSAVAEAERKRQARLDAEQATKLQREEEERLKREEKERRRRNEQLEREMEKLRKKYGDQSDILAKIQSPPTTNHALPPPPPHHHRPPPPQQPSYQAWRPALVPGPQPWPPPAYPTQPPPTQQQPFYPGPPPASSAAPHFRHSYHASTQHPHNRIPPPLPARNSSAGLQVPQNSHHPLRPQSASPYGGNLLASLSSLVLGKSNDGQAGGKKDGQKSLHRKRSSFL